MWMLTLQSSLVVALGEPRFQRALSNLFVLSIIVYFVACPEPI